ncbi:MAG: RHS repeat-associated core domain-containing protein [Pseudomonadota bacterium]
MKILQNLTHWVLQSLLAIGLLANTFAVNAADKGEQLWIPISVGDIMVVIPALTAPTGVQVTGQTGAIETLYQVSWTGVTEAAFYQIEIIDENGQREIRTTRDLSYLLAGLPLGSSTVNLLACNAQNQCGAAHRIGTYTTNERVRYAHADILGSPILETDQAGNVIAEFHYQPFGETEEEKREDIGYTGHLEDTDLGLTYMQARYYDPLLGRFYSNDPVGVLGHLQRGSVQGFNRYTYTYNNPYRYTDPDGRIPLDYAVDGISIAASSAIFASDPSVGNGLALAADVILAAIPYVPAGIGVLRGGDKLVDGVNASRGAESAVSGANLEKQLASESQLSQLAEGGGTVISQPAKQADRIAAQTGAKAENIQKVSSDAHIAKDGQQVQTHSFRDASTNKLIEPKTIIDENF